MSAHPGDQDPPPLGRPIQAPRPAPGQTASPPRATPQASDVAMPNSSEMMESASGRPADTTIGRLPQVPKELKPSQVSQADLDTRKEQHQREKSLVLLQDAQLYEFPQFFTQMLLFLGGTLAVLIGVFLVVEMLQLFAVLNAMPRTFQIVAYVFLCVIFIITAGTVWQWSAMWRRLRVNQQIQLTKVSAASQRLSSEMMGAARKQLQTYLKTYDLSLGSPLYQQFRTLGFGPESLKRLDECRQRLLLESRPISSKEWIDEFRRDWLAALDATARARISRYGKFVALKTAISPYAILDFLVVIYNNFRMLQDLCLLYQVRTGLAGTVYLLGLCIFQAFMAGAVNEALDTIGEDGVEEGADAAAESLGDGPPELVEEASSEGLSRILSGVGENFLGSAAKKAGEGMANWFFLRRIGRQAMRLLQPLT
jgi:uncharacterized membrane protein YcjF (UPF0283 family)